MTRTDLYWALIGIGAVMIAICLGVAVVAYLHRPEKAAEVQIHTPSPTPAPPVNGPMPAEQMPTTLPQPIPGTPPAVAGLGPAEPRPPAGRHRRRVGDDTAVIWPPVAADRQL